MMLSTVVPATPCTRLFDAWMKCRWPRPALPPPLLCWQSVLVILVLVSLPLKPAKIALPILMTGVYVLTLFWSFSRDYFELDLPPNPAWLVVAIASCIGAFAVAITTHLFAETEKQATTLH